MKLLAVEDANLVDGQKVTLVVESFGVRTEKLVLFLEERNHRFHFRFGGCPKVVDYGDVGVGVKRS